MELSELLSDLEAGLPLVRDQEMLELAQRAVETQDWLKANPMTPEQIEAWARRLAEDSVRCGEL